MTLFFTEVETRSASSYKWGGTRRWKPGRIREGRGYGKRDGRGRKKAGGERYKKDAIENLINFSGSVVYPWREVAGKGTGAGIAE